MLRSKRKDAHKHPLMPKDDFQQLEVTIEHMQGKASLCSGLRLYVGLWQRLSC